MKKFVTGLALAAALIVPSISLAANPLFTPATIIKNSLERMFWNKSTEAAGNIHTTVEYVEKNLKNVVVERGYAQVVYDFEGKYRESGESNARLALSVPKLSYTDNGKSQDWENPIGIEVLVVDKNSVYGRITHLSPQLQDLIKSESSNSLDLSPIIGKWVKAPTPDEVQEDLQESDVLEEFNFNIDEQDPDQFLAEKIKTAKDWYLATTKKSGSVLVVTRLGRVTTNSAGEKMQTVRISVNPRWYTALENLVISEYKKENPRATAKQIAAERKSFNTGLAEFKKAIAKVQTDLTLNLTTGKISETTVNYASGRQPEYTYDYKYANGTYKTTKKLTGYSSLNVKTVAKFRPVAIVNLEAPGYSLDADEVVEMVYTEPAKPEYNALEDYSDESDTFGLDPIQ